MTSSELAADREIAGSLPNTWPAFFESFGRLTPVQRAAIPTILDGEDVLVSAATATGKTEAACAPLVERFFDRRSPWTILYISPTRALVNDLHERLWNPISRMGLRLARRTGDHHDSIEQIPNVLLTTPESLDSLLCRGRAPAPTGHVLAHVAAVVLDEIHLVYGTPRGEQLRWLLERLRRLRRQAAKDGWASNDEVQIVGLSATVSDTEGTVTTYLPGGRSIAVGGTREIEVVLASTGFALVEKSLSSYLSSSDATEKVLVFSDSRRRVDELASDLRPRLEQLGYIVCAHHGSLSQKVREQAESTFKEEDAVVVFATSTLELGIDIGDIDLVVLDGPPPTISSLLQRIGRGNRRTSKTRVMACGESPGEELVQEAMLAAARASWLGPPEYGPQHAVVRQQAASYIFQSAKRSRQQHLLQDLIDTCAAPVVARHILDHMLAEGELETEDQSLRLGEDWLDRSGTGQIHSNIEQPLGLEVVDERTGARIAEGLRHQEGPGLGVGGRSYDVYKQEGRTIEVRPSDAGHQGKWRYLTRARMQNASQPQAVRMHLGFGEDVWPVLPQGDQSWVFHFGGARREAILRLAAGSETGSGEGLRINAWFLDLPDNASTRPEWIEHLSAATIELAVADEFERLERVLARPDANLALSTEMRIDEVLGWLQLEDEIALIKAARWEQVANQAVQEQLNSIASILR